MKLTNGEIYNSFNAYCNANKEDMEIPFMTMYKLRKNIQNLSLAYKPIAETISDIMKKYNSDAKNPELNHDLAEISQVVTDVPIEKINASEFNNIKVTPEFMEAIFFMLKD